MTGDLCVYDDVKSRLSLVNDNVEADITGLISSCSESMRQEAGRIFDVETYDEFYSGVGGRQRQLWTRQWPIVSITALYVYPNYGPPNGIPQSPDRVQPGYTWAPGGGKIVLIGYTFPAGSDNIELQYQAGYAPIPMDLSEACIRYVMYIFKSDSWVGMKSKAQAGETTAFITDHMPAGVLRVCQRYKKVVPT
jgi:hypothetical protein